MADPVSLLPLANCAIPIASCAPSACTLTEVYRAQKNLCGISEYLLQQIEALKLALPAQDQTALLFREQQDIKRRLLRLEQSALVCISWNTETNQIQGATITGTNKVFDRDPGFSDLNERVADIERANVVLANITGLTDQMNALTAELDNSIASVTVNGSGQIVSTSVGGISTSASTAAIHSNGPKAATIKQESVTTGASAATYDIPFTVVDTAVIEFDAIFKNPVDGLIYDFDVQTAAGVSINQYDGVIFGAVIDSDNIGADSFHRQRKTLLNMTAGSYKLVISTNTAVPMVSLQISIQIKSLP